jgi:hypothetical protein
MLAHTSFDSPAAKASLVVMKDAAWVLQIVMLTRTATDYDLLAWELAIASVWHALLHVQALLLPHLAASKGTARTVLKVLSLAISVLHVTLPRQALNQRIPALAAMNSSAGVIVFTRALQVVNGDPKSFVGWTRW